MKKKEKGVEWKREKEGRKKTGEGELEGKGKLRCCWKGRKMGKQVGCEALEDVKGVVGTRNGGREAFW